MHSYLSLILLSAPGERMDKFGFATISWLTVSERITTLNNFFSVADLGSGAFLTPGSGTGKNPDPG